MKLFDGINKYTYQTVFGKVQLERKGKDVIFNVLDNVKLGMFNVNIPSKIFEMRFDTRVQALKKLKTIEASALSDLKTLIEKEI